MIEQDEQVQAFVAYSAVGEAPPPLGESRTRERMAFKRARFMEDWRKELAHEQEKCPHTNVLHWSGASTGTLSIYNPIRVCVECGLSETGGWGCYSVDCPHWHTREHTREDLLQPHPKLGPTPGRTFTEATDTEVDRYVLK